MKKILGSLLLLLLCLPLMAQKADGKQKVKVKKLYSLYGEAYDSFTRLALPAKICLMKKDSTMVDTTTVDVFNNRKDSYFKFNIEKTPCEYIVKATYPGYYDTYVNYSFASKGRKYEYTLPKFLMKKDNHDYEKQLDEVVVKATRIQVVHRGDTLVYDATAFVLPEGSMIDALIKQLPGAELKDNGEIFVNGKKIDYLTLNGKKLFNGNNQVMLENLPYYTVKNIKVFNWERNLAEKASQGEGKDYVMDLGLKREYIQNVLGTVEAGGGTQDRWLARIFGLLVGEKHDVMLYANANNLSEDGTPGPSDNWSPSRFSQGVKTNREVGLSAHSENKKKNTTNELEGSLNWNDENIESESTGEVFAKDGNIVTQGFSKDKNKYFSWRLNDEFQHFTDEIGVYSRSYVSYDHAKTISSTGNSTYREQLINESLSQGLIKSDYLNAGTDFFISKRFAWGDALKFMANVDVAHNKPNDSFSLNKMNYAAEGTKEVRNLYSDQHKHSYEYSLGVEYSLGLSHGWDICFPISFKQGYDNRHHSNYRLDRLEEGGFDGLGTLPSSTDQWLKAQDSDNTYSSDLWTKGYKAQVQFRKKGDNHFLQLFLPLEWQHERYHYERVAMDTVATRSKFLFQPGIFYYDWSGNPKQIQYSMSMKQPGFADLMPYGDDTNPLSVRINNPDLKVQLRHVLDTYFAWNSDSTDLSRWIGLNANVIQNSWGTRTSYNTKTGAFTYKSDNVNGNWDAKIGAGFSRSIGKKRHLRISVDGNLGYAHSVDFDIEYDGKGADLSKVNTWRPSLGTNLTYQLSDFRCTVNGKYEGKYSRGNLESFQNINATDFTYGTELQYTIPWLKLGVNTDFTVYSRRGYNASAMNTDDVVWNAMLTRTFWKGNITAKLKAYDLLHQLTNKVYTVNAQGRTETWYNTIPRYVMFSLAFKLHKKAK